MPTWAPTVRKFVHGSDGVRQTVAAELRTLAPGGLCQHCLPQTTDIYAKVDARARAELAQRWREKTS